MKNERTSPGAFLISASCASTLSSSLANSSLGRVAEAVASGAFGEHRLIPTAPALSPKICSKIGQQLQEIYDAVLHEPLPDRLSELLNELRVRARLITAEHIWNDGGQRAAHEL